MLDPNSDIEFGYSFGLTELTKIFWLNGVQKLSDDLGFYFITKKLYFSYISETLLPMVLNYHFLPIPSI